MPMFNEILYNKVCYVIALLKINLVLLTFAVVWKSTLLEKLFIQYSLKHLYAFHVIED